MKRSQSIRVTGFVLGALLVAGAVHAETLSLDLDTVAQFTSTTRPTSGSATLTISDFAPNEVALTLTSAMTGNQTITGLWLNATGLPSLQFAASPTASGPATPAAFGSGGSNYSATQTLVPGGDQRLTGAYDVFVKLPNSGANSLQGTSSETFYLTGTGLSAALFDQSAAQKQGTPNPDYFGMIGVTNVLGAAGTGIGYFGATSVAPVPVPAALPLLLVGFGGLGLFRRRRFVHG
jgi:hypothetical protein